jgi:hypothetical protein
MSGTESDQEIERRLVATWRTLVACGPESLVSYEGEGLNARIILAASMPSNGGRPGRAASGRTGPTAQGRPLLLNSRGWRRVARSAALLSPQTRRCCARKP